LAASIDTTLTKEEYAGTRITWLNTTGVLNESEVLAYSSENAKGMVIAIINEYISLAFNRRYTRIDTG